MNITYFDHNNVNITQSVERMLNTDIPDYEKAQQKDGDHNNTEETG